MCPLHLAEWARACAVFCPCCTSGWQHPRLPEGGLTLPQSPLLCISAWLLFWVQALSPDCVILGVGPGWLTTLHLVFSPSVLLVTLGCTGLPGTTQLPSFALISWSVSWSQAFCLPSVHERLRSGQQSLAGKVSRTKYSGTCARVPRAGLRALPEGGPVTKVQKDLGLIMSFSLL